MVNAKTFRMGLLILFIASILSNASAATLPFYFPKGIIQTSDPVKQMQEWARYFAAVTYRFQGSEHNPYNQLIAGSDSIVVVTNLDSTASIASEKPRKCIIVLEHFVRMSNGIIRVTQLTDQFFITEEELKVTVDDIVTAVKRAAKNNYEYYKNIPEVALVARANKIYSQRSIGATAPATFVAAFRKNLDEKDPLCSEVTMRETHFLPKPIKESDFIPREVHLGYNTKIEGILGLTLLNTGVVHLNPLERILDYLTGEPKILQHEMVHSCAVLEKFPHVSGFDPEMLAMFPEVFLEQNKIDLFFHHYCKDLREICRVFAGFDFEEAKNQIFKYDSGGALIIDEVKYKEYFQKLEYIKKELARVIRDYVIPEFYSDQVRWSAIHDKLRDKNGILWIMMAKHFHPTVMGGAKKTEAWLTIHHEEIMSMARIAFQGNQIAIESDDTIADVKKILTTLFGGQTSPYRDALETIEKTAGKGWEMIDCEK